MEDIKCPKCGKLLSNQDRHYWYCVRIDELNEGCNTLWGKSIKCYFTGLYVVNDIGEIIAYKQDGCDGGRIIKTNKLLPKYRGWKLD